MRGDLALELRLALRREGAVGLAGAVAGTVGVLAAYLPWYEVHARVSILGHTRTTAVTSLAGWQAQPWIWVGTALAATALFIGLSLTLDRPPHWWREGLLATAIGLAIVAGTSALFTPPRHQFLADGELPRLQRMAERVPNDVEVSFNVVPATGLWLTLGTAALLVLVTLAARTE